MIFQREGRIGESALWIGAESAAEFAREGNVTPVTAL